MERKQLTRRTLTQPLSDLKNDLEPVYGNTQSSVMQRVQSVMDFSTEGVKAQSTETVSVNNTKKLSNNPNGRPKGALNKRTQQMIDAVIAKGQTPLEYMVSVMHNTENDEAFRLDAAKAVAPYIHPKLSSTEISGPNKGAIPITTTALPVDASEAAKIYKQAMGQ